MKLFKGKSKLLFTVLAWNLGAFGHLHGQNNGQNNTNFSSSDWYESDHLWADNLEPIDWEEWLDKYKQVPHWWLEHSQDEDGNFSTHGTVCANRYTGERVNCPPPEDEGAVWVPSYNAENYSSPFDEHGRHYDQQQVAGTSSSDADNGSYSTISDSELFEEVQGESSSRKAAKEAMDRIDAIEQTVRSWDMQGQDRQLQEQVDEYLDSYDRSQRLQQEIQKDLQEIASNMDAIQNSEMRLNPASLQNAVNELGSYHNERSQSVLGDLPQEALQYESEHQLVNPELRKQYRTGHSQRKLKSARDYKQYVDSQISQLPTGEERSMAQAHSDAAGAAFDESDRAYDKGHFIDGDMFLEAGVLMLDVALSITPGVSWGKDMVEAWTGVNQVTGERLDTFDRSMAILGVASLGVLSKFKFVKTLGGKGASLIGKIFRKGKVADTATGAVKHSNEVIEAVRKLEINGKDIADVTKEVNHFVPGKVTEIYEAAAKNKPLGKGITGRADPASIKEQAALLVTRADPQNGQDLTPLLGNLGDSRWHANDGWIKMQTVFDTSSGNITIHYVRNTASGSVDDFKFINNPL